jgi:hypothetical protein
MKNLKNLSSFDSLKEERVYGSDEIRKLQSKIGPDEWISLDDTSGELSGEKVSKIEYVKIMLKRAIEEKNWTLVSNAILFIDTQMK